MGLNGEVSHISKAVKYRTNILVLIDFLKLKSLFHGVIILNRAKLTYTKEETNQA